MTKNMKYHTFLYITHYKIKKMGTQTDICVLFIIKVKF